MQFGHLLGVGTGKRVSVKAAEGRRMRGRRAVAEALGAGWERMVEAMERRVLLAAVAWDGGGDGVNWHDAKNWSGDVLPGAGDDVTISVAASPTIQLTAGAVTINSLVSDEALTLSGGTLDVATTVKVNNVLTMSGGTLTRANVLQGDAASPFVAGKLGSKAVSFDGVDDSVDLGDPADNHLDLGTNATIEAWVRFDAIPADGLITLVSKDAGGGDQAKWIFGYSNNHSGLGNATVFHVNAPGVGSAWMASDTWTPVVGQWYHLAVVKSGSSYSFYRDGVLNGMSGTTIAVPQVNAPMMLGQAEGANRLAGGLDDVRVWSTARTSVQITTNRSKQLAGTESGLVGYWQMNEAGGTTIGDATSYATTGTFKGLDNTEFKVTGNVSFNGATVDAAMQVAAGTVTATGGGTTTLRGAVTFSGSGFAATGAGTTLSAPGVASLSNTTVTAEAGAAITFEAVGSLANVNLYASDGGQILFPAATSYTGHTHAHTTIQASGAGSRIDLSHLQALVGGGSNWDSGFGRHYTTYVNALGGGEVDLAGVISNRNVWMVDGAASVLGVGAITKLGGTSLTATAAGTLGFMATTEVTDSSLSAAQGVTLAFPLATTLANVTLMASEGGMLLFPAATSYAGGTHRDTTIQASGVGSRIDLSQLQSLVGGGANWDSGFGRYYTTYVNALDGGEVDLAGVVGNRNNWTVDGAASVLGAEGITSLSGTTMTVTRGATVTFPSVTVVSSVNLYASEGGRMLFPAATSYSGDTHSNTTIQASGANSRIDLSQLQALVGGGSNWDSGFGRHYTTYVNVLDGGEVDLAGAISNRYSIAVQPNARLDLNPKGLVVIQGDLASVTALIGSGRNGGKWDGMGITCSAATEITTLGVLQRAEGVVVKHTYYGDVNLDGEVNLTDYFTVDYGYLTKATGYGHGDVNYDGEINLSDYFLIDSAYLRQGTAMQASAASASTAKPSTKVKAKTVGKVFSKKVIRRRVGR